MRFVNYQELAAKTAIYPDILKYMIDWMNNNGWDMVGEDLEQIQAQNVVVPNIYYPMMGLSGEVGELSNKIKKIMRDDQGIISPEKKADLMDELGDIIWYISAMATELDMNLGEVAARNIDKLHSRQKRGVLGGSGDDR